jgi:hypothetical protein
MHRVLSAVLCVLSGGSAYNWGDLGIGLVDSLRSIVVNSEASTFSAGGPHVRSASRATSESFPERQTGPGTP